MPDAPQPKIALLPLPEHYTLPGRPGGATAAVIDCHRQTGFVLGTELAEFASIMDHHLEAVRAISKPLVHEAAATLTYGARTYGLLADACALLTQGSYGSCLPLMRSAINSIATMRSLTAGDDEDYAQWLAVAVRREETATAFDLGRYHASSVIAEDARLETLYRILSDLSMPYIGSTLLLAAPEADAAKISISFPDGSFHLGWAELITGWLLEIAAASLAAIDFTGEKSKAAAASVEVVHATRPRCHVREENGRWVIDNYRRNSRGQPRRVIIG